MMATILFNGLMFLVDALALRTLAQAEEGREFQILRRSLLQVAVVASLLAIALATGFGRLSLLAFGVFLHGLVMLGGSAWLLRRRGRGRLAAGSSIAALGLIVVAVDAFLVEPRWLEVSHIHLTSPKVKTTLTLALLADFQTDEIGAYERRVLREIMAAKPDLILMAGDYIQEADPQRYQELREELRKALQETGFSAPLGVIAVGGNVDPRHWPTLFEGLSITAVTATRDVKIPPLQVTALSMQDSFRTTLEVKGVEPFHIVLGHAPDFALGSIEADLLVAGHIHGGQVRLPLVGPLMTLSRVPRSWSTGATRLPGGATLVVSRGSGMERHDAPRLRFLCRPQLVIIEISPTRAEPERPE